LPKELHLTKNHIMKKLLPLVFILATSAVIFSCHHLKQEVKDVVTYDADPNYDYAANHYAKGFVTDVQLDGCKWMIQLVDSAGKKIEPGPDELPPTFLKDSLLVWVKYTPEDRLSVCMAGQTVHVQDIKKRNK
jgi:hypothetical protein